MGTLTCPQGHEWQVSSHSASPESPATCPVCGAPPDTLLQPNLTPENLGEAAPTNTLLATGETKDAKRAMPGQQRGGVLPTVPGYEILRVLGRGGTAVVYLARHSQLKRLVALKMVLGGEHADPSEMARFRTEAEAVAKLAHPRIIQIYEVGDHDGRPYLALEFLDSGSLHQRIAGKPQPPGDACQLVETLARAMHYAHECGIVHRDLKPANVLLSSEGRPKITDFGLAKSLGAGKGHTRTGDILGTPSYMAPEQAAGNPEEIGPATDVYALGAILYEMLTGRPPFLGRTPAQTLSLVLLGGPVSPRQLQPEVPRDVEIICLKCLELEPAKRYADAQALADDLQRFLKKEPIQARAASLRERVVKWARRNPTRALIAVLAVAVVIRILVIDLYWRGASLRAERDTAYQQRDDARLEAARMYALAAAIVRDDPKLSSLEREVKAEAYATRALALLREAHKAGYFADAVKIEQLKNHVDFESLRSREDFREFLREVEEEAKRRKN